jgi:hypothetical protein
LAATVPTPDTPEPPVAVVTPAGSISGGHTLKHASVQGTGCPALVSVYTALPWLSTRIVPFEVLAVLTTAAEVGAVVVVADDFFEDFELLLEPPQAASTTTATAPSATTARAIFVPPLIAPRFMSRPLHDHAGMAYYG